MYRMFHSVLRQNSTFFISFIIGLSLSLYLRPLMTQNKCVILHSESLKHEEGTQDIDNYEPKINLAAKPKNAVKGGRGIVRPRFHKAELGIKNKLFLGVLTSPETIATLALALNKTASKYVNKVMYFIDAPSAQRLNVSSLKLPGIVGFTDTRKVLKPFHLIKYVSDNFLEDFDFFFIVKDSGYIHAPRLMEFVKKISIKIDIHTGHLVDSNSDSVCSLDFGVILSNSVMRKVKSKLEWCVKNAVSKDDNVNFGNCVIQASGPPCSQTAQGSYFYTSSIKKGSASIIPTSGKELQEFDKAIVISPLSQPEYFYQINFYYSVAATMKLDGDIENIRRSVSKQARLRAVERGMWPVASQPPAVPQSHFDILRWDYFNQSHKYLHTDFSNLEPLKGAEKEDIHRIVSRAVSFVENKYDGVLKFATFINGYQRFDASRGMDYIVDLAFRETTSGKTVHKRLEVFKALGKVEMIPVPYVTENVRVYVVIPVKSSDIEAVLTFLKLYSINAMEKKDLQLLMLVFIYNSHESSKGNEDIFKEVKSKALTLSNKFEKVGNVIKWHSIKLPVNRPDLAILTESLLDFAVLDSVLKKFPLESLILVGRPNMEVRLDYFNRVRMNTVSGFQIFSAVPFSEYHPDLIYSKSRPRPPELDINKNYGHYDSTNFRHISFYTVDYFKARKKIENIIPIVKNDKDIWKLTPPPHMIDSSAYELYTSDGIYNMFVAQSEAHVLRGMEPSLRLRHVDQTCVYCQNPREFNSHCTKLQASNLATRSQLGRIILDYKAEVKSVK